MMSVEVPRPVVFRSPSLTRTVTSPMAWLPPVMAWIEYSSTLARVLVTWLIASYVASTGPSPQADCCTRSSPSTRTRTVAEGTVPVPLTVCRYSSAKRPPSPSRISSSTMAIRSSSKTSFFLSASSRKRS